MNRGLPPNPKRESGAFAGSRPLGGRRLFAGACMLGAAYLAFAVGAPWMLREAPPDTYSVVATGVLCAAGHDAGCADAPPLAH